MELGGSWRSGNNGVQNRVAADVEPSIGDGGRDQEDLTTTTTTASQLAPVSMSHLEQFTDGEWVEPSDELTGTAVFDATGVRLRRVPFTAARVKAVLAASR